MLLKLRVLGVRLFSHVKGDFASQETILRVRRAMDLNFIKTSADTEIIQAYYNLKILVIFTKCTNLCNSIEMYMKNNFPIVIKFSVGSLGSLKLALAPKIEID